MGAFNSIAMFIARRYKAIIVFWMIAIFVAIPFTPRVVDAVEYYMHHRKQNQSTL